MNDVRNKYVPPTISETAFNCPHCGALAKQFWFSVHADKLEKDHKPFIVYEGDIEQMLALHEHEELRGPARESLQKAAKGRPYLEANQKYRDFDVSNISISQCYNCDDIAIWIYDRLVWPRRGETPPPNPDLPESVREDYDEASTILDLSPRGAAALLRLGIQKLCEHLGEPGENVNNDIAVLVKKGLDKRVQQALDVVRVVGNNAVHPGQIDLKDDRATAEKLFGLVNLIAEIMISQPKHVGAMYDGLPEKAREAIERRDKSS